MDKLTTYVQTFLLRRQSNIPPQNHLMASTYVGTVVLVLCFLNKECRNILKPLATVVFIIGISETLQFIGRETVSNIVISLIFHTLIYYVALSGKPTWVSYLITTLILFGILVVYMSANTWPYASTPIVLFGMTMSLFFVSILNHDKKCK